MSHQSSSAIQQVLDHFADCADLVHRTYPAIQTEVIFLGTIVDDQRFNDDVVKPLLGERDEGVLSILQQSQFEQQADLARVVEAIAEGYAAIFHQDLIFLTDVYGPEYRNVDKSETESIITGPHDSFIESIETNIGLIRKRLRSPRLKTIKLRVGEISRSTVYVLYIDGIADLDIVNELVKRITDIEIDGILDTNLLVQSIDDNPDSIFPQFLTTERPDITASKLLGGRICCMIDCSPTAAIAPANFFEFFISPDDYYQRWVLASGIRILRYAAFIITISLTALYVAVTTFHYEMIPYTLLLSLAESRDKVPFPPLIEALLMEITIELLREAGARLPAKIAQTIGIVGGIVIGQAAVQAGLTSNILIIAVASSAIASFVIPSYIMSASIRMIRFGLIILAGVWGMMGLVIGLGWFIIHLAGLKNLNTSYLTPIAPMNLSYHTGICRGARKLSKVDEQERLAEEIEEYVKKKAMHMINTAQKIGADCFGIGQYVRNSLSAKEWMETDWRAVYPHIETDVLVNVKIRNYGTNE